METSTTRVAHRRVRGQPRRFATTWRERAALIVRRRRLRRGDSIILLLFLPFTDLDHHGADRRIPDLLDVEPFAGAGEYDGGDRDQDVAVAGDEGFLELTDADPADALDGVPFPARQ